MRRASFAPLYRASGFGWFALLSCISGGESSEFSATPAISGAANADAGGASQAGVAGAQAGAAPAAGGNADFGAEASGSGGGISQAGEVGMSGSNQSVAGVAGSSEPTPGGGNAGTTATGGTGTAGNSGSTGSAGAPGGLKTCAEACTTEHDCRVGTSDYGFDCNPSSQRCERLGFPCKSSTECLPAASLWFFACSSDADCFYFDDDVCVSVAGVGRCARLAPGDDIDDSGCESPTPDAVLIPRAFGGGSALVCADAGRRCEEGACVAACGSHDECTPARNGSHCDLTSGACLCVKDADCGGPGVSHCNLESGRCECTGEADCKEIPGSDSCVDGRCGCSSVAACNEESLFAGTKRVCE